ncbi:MAG: TGS domain-containing protein [Anaerolineae bacterium]|nr:TGS domain-containing protein [Anaerolineae bacterium]
MPTNLPPEYYQIEEQFREATTSAERISLLEEMLSVIPKHKGTDKLRAELRRKLSRLKESAESSKTSSRQVSPFVIDREGAGQAAIIGPANVGKSSLVRALTNATPDVADYPYTTAVPVPGMMQFENVQIQLLDTPPLSREYEEPQLLDLVRRCDLILLVLDLQGYPLDQYESTVDLLVEHRIIPRHLEAQHSDTLRRLFIKPMIVLVNKVDDETFDEDFAVLCELLGVQDECPFIPVSAQTGRNLDRMRQAVFEALDIIRIYSRPPGKEPNLNAPFTLKRGSTVEDFAEKVHKDFVENLKSARIWGTAVFEGQPVGRDHILHDGDVVELRA